MIFKIILTFFYVWSIALSAFAQMPTYRKQLMENLIQFPVRCPQEKLYLHTDKEHYEAGDSIWFRAYLVNARTHQESDMSRFVYAELRSQQDSVLTRVKIQWRDSVFAGYVPLNKSIKQGTYTLRAFSWWMQNVGDDFVFRKKINIINPQDSKVNIKSSYDELGNLIVTFVSFAKEPYTKLDLQYTLGKRTKHVKTNQNGQIKIPIEKNDRGKYIKYVFGETAPFEYEGEIYVAKEEDEFHVDFFAEGGHLLADQPQTISFKCLGTDGLSREINGHIENDKGEFIVPMSTIHSGMGAIELSPKGGESYKAKVKMKDGTKEHTFNLPQVETDGITLKIMVSSRNVGYKVLKSGNIPDDKQFYVMAHMRGTPLLCEKVTPNTIMGTNVNDLPEGVLHFVLLDNMGNIHSERMCFIRHVANEIIDITTNNKIEYRSGINLSVALIDKQKISGSFSVSVTDATKCEKDSLAGNILTNLLLTSDLKGYIEDPAYYFKSFSPSTIIKLDLLMRTQGWRRFDVASIMKKKYPPMPFYLERGQSIEGRVNNLRGHNASQAGLMLMSTTGMFRMTTADNEGKFLIDDVSFAENTHFVIQAKNQKGRRNVEVTIEPEPFLVSEFRYPMGTMAQKKENDFFARFQKDYYYDNGVKVFILDEAIIRSNRIQKNKSIEEAMADYVLDSAKMANFQPADMTFLLQELPGVTFYDNEVQCFAKKIPVVMDGFLCDDMGIIQNLQPRDLKSICLIKPPKAQIFWGSEAENGVLVIETNPFFTPYAKQSLNINAFVPLGYQRQATCYMPHYEIDSIQVALKNIADMRTTIYWNPNVKIHGDNSIQCFFNASDNPGPYRVVIEGILSNGQVIRKEKMIK